MARKHNDSEIAFALAVAAEIDDDIEELKRLLGTFNTEVQEAADRDDAQRTLLAIGLFLGSFETHVRSSVQANGLWMAQQMSSRYSVDVQPIIAPDTQEQAALLIATTRSLIEENRDMALLMASSTGSGLARNLGSILTLGDLNSIHKATDFALHQSLERDGYVSGRGIFPRKVAVALQDDSTTDLCGTRMDGQERGWDELYVDPVSGASWMFPPFVGAGLNRSEAFHFCRSVSVALL